MTGLQIKKTRSPSLWGLLVQHLQHCKENYHSGGTHISSNSWHKIIIIIIIIIDLLFKDSLRQPYPTSPYPNESINDNFGTSRHTALPII